MNLLNKKYFFIAVLFFSHQVFAQDCKALISISSNKEKASIYINNELVAEGVQFNAEVEQGTHIIMVKENTLRWGNEVFTDTIYVGDCKSINLNYIFEKEIVIDTEPQDVYVFNEDTLLGNTPLSLKNNFNQLQLQKDGYLSKTVSYSDFQSDSKIKLDFIGEADHQKFINTIWFKVLVGTAVALGATTAYFKLEADKKFDEYQIVGNPALLDQTDKYDLISGVTFTALQINFGLIFYLFLTD